MSDRDKAGRFQTGNTEGPGRPKGSRNKLGEAFLADLHAAWERNGKAALERLAEEQPAAFVRAVASILPKELDIKPVNSLEQFTDEELERLIEILDREAEAEADDGKREAA